MVDNTYREIINIGRHNLPMVDFHVYLRPGLSLEQVLRKSREGWHSVRHHGQREHSEQRCRHRSMAWG